MDSEGEVKTIELSKRGKGMILIAIEFKRGVKCFTLPIANEEKKDFVF